MPDDRTMDTPVGVTTPISLDRRSRIRLPLPVLGAVLGGVIAFVATGILVQTLVVALGAAVGYALGWGGVLLIERARTAEVDDQTREQLYEQARELDVEGRSQMTKDELATAVAEAQDGQLS